VTITSYPFELQDVSESQFSRFFRELQDSGVVGEVGNGGFTVSSDGSGLDVQIDLGFGIVRGHAIDSDAVESRTLATADGTNPRIDLVVLRLDPVANGITIEVVTGSPATTPVAPNLTQTETGIYEIALAQVRVAAGSLNIAAGDITDRRIYLGQRVGNWTTATRPSGPQRARLGYNSNTLSWEFWNGTTWEPLAGKKTARIPHTFTISGDVRVASGDVDYMPPFFVPVPTSQTVKAAIARHRINSGTSATVTLRRRTTGGTATDIAANVSVTTTTSTTDFADFSLNSDESLELVVTAVSGAPKNLTFTVYLDYTI
jgi:hypothetical protein